MCQPPATTADPPAIVGHLFAADVLRRDKQFILLVRESITSFTAACLIDGDRTFTPRPFTPRTFGNPDIYPLDIYPPDTYHYGHLPTGHLPPRTPNSESYPPDIYPPEIRQP